MTNSELKLLEICRKAYHYGRRNGLGLDDKMFHDFIQIENVYEALGITSVTHQRELFLGFQESEYFDLYEQGVIEYKEAIEKYLSPTIVL